ncbi:MAG TPA: hypothetical protein VG735_11685, partial [Caulobacterales bacterium]|nr:hypothetical protein [Caulobacterales bacterium]
IIGSNNKGAIYRAKAGSAKAAIWLDPAKTGMRTVLGVYADDASNTLYVCSASPYGQPRQAEFSALRTFDLKTGAAKASYPMIDPDKAVCNDIAIDKDGAAFITDTAGGRVMKLAKGAPALSVWFQDDRLEGIDGIAFGDRGLYVNTVGTSRLFRIEKRADGTAGALTELTPSLPLKGPDGLRALGGEKFLMAESTPTSGRVSEVTITGDKAELRVLTNDAPGVTAIARIGDRVWVNRAKFGYRKGPLQGQSPEPFVEYVIPYR